MKAMRHRLVALLLVTIVGATPLARELCSVSCAEHHPASASSPPHAHHGSHGSGQAMATHEEPGHRSAQQAPGHPAQAPGVHASGMASPHAAHTTSMACCDSALSIGQQSCAHGTDSQAAAPAATASMVDAPAVVAVLVEPPGLSDGVALSTPADSPRRTPTPHSLRTPLRV
jgi:hypothetical protein